MAFSLLQNKSGLNNTANGDYTGSDLLVVLQVMWGNAGAGTVTDTQGNTYTNRTTYTQGTNSRCRGSYVVSPSLANPMHASPSGAFQAGMLAGFSGVDTGSPFDTESGNTGTTTSSVQPGSVTPANAGSLLLAVLCVDGSITGMSINSGFTTLDSIAFSSGNNYGLYTAYLIQGAAAAINPTWSWTTNRNVATGLYVFKPAAAAASNFPALIVAA